MNEIIPANGPDTDYDGWPCMCPDSFLANTVRVEYCPRHTLGPELVAAWGALHDSVAGDAAPEGTTLAERIRALGGKYEFEHRAHGVCHDRHMRLERAGS